MNYLARREHSGFELCNKLKAKGIDEVLARQAVAELAERGLQSDERFIEMFVRSRTSRGYGESRIRQELRLKGIEQGWAESLEEQDWDGSIKNVYLKKYRDGLPKSPKELALRMRFLMRRGFSSDQIRALFRRLSLEDTIDEEN